MERPDDRTLGGRFLACLSLVLGALLLGFVPWSAAAEPIRSFGEVLQLRTPGDVQIPFFGYAIAIDGDTAVIGAPQHETEGAALIFERDPVDPTLWNRTAKLRADGEDPAECGFSVAIRGDTALMGCWGERRLDDELRVGAAYVFERDPLDPASWLQTARLTLDGVEDRTYFGTSVGIDGDTAVVGCPEPSEREGVYVFERDPGGAGGWEQVAWLRSEEGTHWGVGRSVAIDGDTVLTGAPDNWFGYETALVFERLDPADPTSWELVAELRPDEWASEYGRSVALSGDTAAVGDYGSTLPVPVFERDPGDPTSWQLAAEIQQPDDAALHFGFSVALEGDTLVVGARSTFPPEEAGSAHVFQRTGGEREEWELVANIDASVEDSSFGATTAVDGGTVMVGSVFTPDYGRADALEPVTSGHEARVPVEPYRSSVAVPSNPAPAGDLFQDIVYIFEEIEIDPALAISGSCPGEARITATGLTPRGSVRFYGAWSTGFDAIPDGPCAGDELGVGRAVLVREGRADVVGAVDITVPLTAEKCGVRLQVLDETTCASTPVVMLP